MADVWDIIRNFEADPKAGVGGPVYRDEPVLFTARQLAGRSSPEIREMRAIARNGGGEAKVFREQGLFMASYEDDCEYLGDFVQYFPTYQAMTDTQLRGYFTWRTRLRQGKVAAAPLSFAFVYIYELLNLIGVESAEEGFDTLFRFWTAYREIDWRVNRYVPLWLRDFVVYYRLDRALLDQVPEADADGPMGVLLEYSARGAEEVFQALDALSSYNMTASKFFVQYPDDVVRATYRVFCAIAARYDRNPAKGMREKLFGRLCTSSYAMFRSAVFFHQPLGERRVYALGPGHRYIYDNCSWRCERFVGYGRNNKRIGAMLKTIDFFLRRSRGFKSSLLPGKTNKQLTAWIEKEVALFEKERVANLPPVINIDVSRLPAIRAAAEATRDRLLVDVEDEAEPPVLPPEPVGSPEPVAIASGEAVLGEAEREFVLGLLRGGDVPGGAAGTLLADAVNERLYEIFNDTVIVDGAGGPEVVEDYREDLEAMLNR